MAAGSDDVQPPRNGNVLCESCPARSWRVGRRKSEEEVGTSFVEQRTAPPARRRHNTSATKCSKSSKGRLVCLLASGSSPLDCNMRLHSAHSQGKESPPLSLADSIH